MAPSQALGLELAPKACCNKAEAKTKAYESMYMAKTTLHASSLAVSCMNSPPSARSTSKRDHDVRQTTGGRRRHALTARTLCAAAAKALHVSRASLPPTTMRFRAYRGTS